MQSKRWAIGGLKSLSAALLASVFAAACSNHLTGVRPGAPSIRIISGKQAADTISAFLPGNLIVEVRDSLGAVQPGALVHFESSLIRMNGVDRPGLSLSADAKGLYQSALSVKTDPGGRGEVRVRMGDVAGEAAVSIEVRSIGLTAQAFYTIKPGAATQVSITPRDTAVFMDASYTVRTIVLDRAGNSVAAIPTLTASGPVKVSGRIVSAEASGRARIVATLCEIRDSAFVSVVPKGTLLAARADGIYVFALDGSDLRRVTQAVSARAGRWMPGGENFVFSIGTSHARLADLNGGSRPLLQNPAQFAAELWVHPSRDGAWLYFGGYDNAEFRGYPYRVSRDGSRVEVVPGFTIDGFTQAHPTVSPEGNRLAYFREEGSSRNVFLRVLDMSTGDIIVRDVPGHAPEWSHGDSIAYLDMRGGTAGPLRLMSSLGRSHRQIGNGIAYDFGFDWSPDDRWIVARDVVSNRLEVIEVSTGARLPLPYTIGFHSPSWRP